MSSSAFSPNVGQLNYSTPVGCVLGFAAETSPIGWLECNGASLDTSIYAELFGVIGYVYGGSGSSFNLPDYRGKFLRGWDHGATNDPDAASRTDRGDTTTGDNIGTQQSDAFQGHKHGMYANGFDPVGGGNNDAPTDPNTQNQLTSIPVSDGTNGTPRTTSETRPININIMYCIKYSSESTVDPSLDNLAIGLKMKVFLADEAAYYSGSSKWLNLTSNTTYDKTTNPEYGDWFSTWNILTDSFTTETFDDRFERLSDSRAVGNTQEDAFQGHGHIIGYNHTLLDGASRGALQQSGNTTTSDPVATSWGTPRLASETRPKNIAAKIYVKIA